MIWVYIAFALISMFLSSGGKKPTAKDAAVGVAAGLGAYYVGTQTEWGKSTVSSIESSLGLGGSASTVDSTPDGSATTVTNSATGSALAGLGAGIGSGVKTLVPIAAAAGVGAVVGSTSAGKYVVYGAGALLVYWLLTRNRKGTSTVVVSPAPAMQREAQYGPA